MQSINPATNSLIKTYEPLTEPELEARLALAQRAFGDWKRQPFDVRATMMRKAAALLRERSRALAELMTAEMGKPIAGGLGEVNKCAWVCEYYAEEAEGFLRDEGIDTDARRSFVASRPLGPVLAVMPWNFPFWQVFRFAAPALMAGNVGLLKHASNVPGCALAIEAIFLDAGFPPGVFTTLLVGSDRVEGLIADRRVVAVTLTGSTPAGKAVAAAAGAALKKSVLELGGSDPYVLLADADLEQAVPLCVFARLLNSGQSCIAAKRFIVVESIREEFEERF
ncbi:MAG: aldehyde dehydrogenase family protein, partial [Armatimonadetes bacterium]|nr:aldehyde dehydrogenase family protein [Armatimonadota bacterium]